MSDIVFDDGKDPQALRTIGEVAKALGIRQHVLRYWEEQFPSLKPVKRSGGRRYYRPDDVRLIARIHSLVHEEGYTLRGARQAIMTREPSTKAATSTDSGASLMPNLAAPFPDTQARLRQIRGKLAAALDQA